MLRERFAARKRVRRGESRAQHVFLYLGLKFSQVIDFDEFQIAHPEPVLQVHYPRFDHERVQQVDRVRAVVQQHPLPHVLRRLVRERDAQRYHPAVVQITRGHQAQPGHVAEAYARRPGLTNRPATMYSDERTLRFDDKVQAGDPGQKEPRPFLGRFLGL